MVDRNKRIVIKEHNPLRIWMVAFILIIAGLIGSVAAYYVGLDRGLHDESLIENRINDLRRNIALLDKRNRELTQERGQYDGQLKKAKQKAIALQSEKVMDREALNNNLLDMITYQDKLGKLAEELQFYKAILSPANGEAGLAIHRAKLFGTQQQNSYNYQVTLVQGLTHDVAVKGKLSFVIEGIQDGEATALDLPSVSQPETSNHAYSFKYYETFDGHVILPEGFTPVRIVVTAQPKGRGAKPLEAKYSWNDVLTVDSGADIVNTAD